MRTFFIVLVSLYALIACKEVNHDITKTVKTKIYSVKGIDTYEIDTIQFIEMEMFDSRDIKVEHHYLYPDGTLKAKEIYEFEGGSKFPKSSSYYDFDGNRLSYYKFMYDSTGERLSSHAHDASNDELLRIERYKYDDQGNRYLKEIRNADDELERSFSFSYDEEGTQTALTVMDKKGDLLMREDYKIIARDKKSNEWIEMWGFIGNKPNTCKVREITP